MEELDHVSPSPAETSTTADSLPNEILLVIFAFLDSVTYFSSVPRVCRRWHAVSLDHSRQCDLTFLPRKSKLRVAMTHRHDDLAVLACAVESRRFQRATFLKIPPWLKGNDRHVRTIVPHCPNLISIELPYCSDITNTSLSVISVAYPNLQAVHLPGCPNITENEISCLAQRCTKLSVVDFSSCSLDARVLQHLARCCPALSCIRFNNNRGLEDDFLIELANRCPSLVELRVRGQPSLRDKGVVEMAEMCQSLEVLDLSYANVTSRSLFAISNFCQNLRVLYFPDCTSHRHQFSDHCRLYTSS